MNFTASFSVFPRVDRPSRLTLRAGQGSTAQELVALDLDATLHFYSRPAYPNAPGSAGEVQGDRKPISWSAASFSTALTRRFEALACWWRQYRNHPMTFHGFGHSSRIWRLTGAQELLHLTEVFGSYHAWADDSQLLGGYTSVVCLAVSRTPRNA